MSTLQLSHVSVAALGGKVLVSDFSATVNSGELHLLLGANGSGKSSLLNGIFGHPRYQLINGEVFIDGEDITALTVSEKARKGLFLSPQHAPPIPGVTLINFLYRVRSEVFGESRDPLAFHEHLKKEVRGVGLDESILLRELHKGLSGGEWKQIEMIQLLALRPKFVFLDEIDSGVDVDIQKKFWKILEKLRGEGIAFMIITHHAHLLSSIEPTAVSIMAHGRIVKTGSTHLLHQLRDHGFAYFVDEHEQ